MFEIVLVHASFELINEFIFLLYRDGRVLKSASMSNHEFANFITAEANLGYGY